MTKLGFERCGGDQAVFFRRCEKTNVLIVVLVHVDDCSIVGKTKALIARFKVEIAKFVEITDMGELHWILGIEVRRIREERKILLSQKSYIDSILRRYNFDGLGRGPVKQPHHMTRRFAPEVLREPTSMQESANSLCNSLITTLCNPGLVM